jgi:protoporphyrinogen oxidase
MGARRARFRTRRVHHVVEDCFVITRDLETGSDAEPSNKHVIVIGAGPAGLTAAYELQKLGVRSTVLEKDDIVGGLSRTEQYDGYHFDMGGHRFFTKVPEVNKMWREVLKDEFLRRPRLSRIYYGGTYFAYPLKPLNALGGLGVYQSFRVGLSYLKWQVAPHRPEDTFEEWVTNRFGRRLFLIFFRAYTEKVWGVSCSELKAEWAAQRIKDLSLRTAVTNMLFKPRRTIKTLIEEFEYPRLGPGMMWETVARQLQENGNSVEIEAPVERVHREGMRVISVSARVNGTGCRFTGTDFISSMPVAELVSKLEPPAPPDVLEAARNLSYRSFLTVCLIVKKPDLFPDNWIYVHDPKVNVGRIQNYKNWSPDMVADQTKTGLGLEYFCDEGDALWCTPDEDLIAMARKELAQIGLANTEDVERGCVFRMAKAYPVYDSAYGPHLERIKDYLAGFENLHTVGRNGLHRYNNQDHAMVTGMLAARNVVLGETNDVWSVNTDMEYHEEIAEAEEALIEAAFVGEDAAVAEAVFAKLDRTALGVAGGVVLGTLLGLLTLVAHALDLGAVRSGLALLAAYFPGYRVSILGALLGLFYGCLTGFAAGWVFALVRNTVALLYVYSSRRRAERLEMRHLLDYV